MKLTKKFWTWLSQVFALTIFIIRADFIVWLFKLIPFCDGEQFFPVIVLFILVAVSWGTWLIWRAYEGFYTNMDFLIDGRHRW